MIQIDQFKEYTEDEIRFGKAVSLLIETLYNEDGTPKDIADKEGRDKLINMIQRLPKDIPTKLSHEDRLLMENTIKECREAKDGMKMWFWYVVGAMFVAVTMMFFVVLLLFR